MAERPSFELTKYSPPEKTAADYSEAEKEGFRQLFKPAVARGQTFNNTFLILLVVCLPLFFFSRHTAFYPLFIATFISIIAVMIVGSIVFQLRCPACKKPAEDTIRTFCPECGGKAIPGGLLYAGECASCGKKLRRTVKGRRLWKIKYCTHCGVLLTDTSI